MKTKRAKKKVVKHLPKKIRNELMLCCALKAHDTLALSKQKREGTMQDNGDFLPWTSTKPS